MRRLAAALLFASIPSLASAGDRALFVPASAAGALTTTVVDVSTTGKLTTKNQTSMLAVSTDRVFATAAGVVFYDSTQYGCLYAVDGFGVVYDKFNHFFPSVTSVAAIAGLRDFVMLYDGGADADISEIGVTGTSHLQSITNFSPWTDLISTKNYILFYNRKTGVAAAGTIDNGGQFAQSASTTIPAGYETFAVAGDAIVAYDRSTGNLLVLNFTLAGGVQKVGTAKIAAGYTQVAQHGGLFLFYNPTSGAMQTGTLSPSTGAWTSLKKTTGTPGYTLEIGTDHGILFYDRVHGALAVGRIDSTGTYAVVGKTTMPKGYTLAAALK